MHTVRPFLLYTCTDTSHALCLASPEHHRVGDRAPGVEGEGKALRREQIRLHDGRLDADDT